MRVYDGGDNTEPSGLDLGTTSGAVGAPLDGPSRVIQTYKWLCHGKHPCEECLSQHGQVKSLDEWQSSGLLPGWHFGCQCDLVPVDQAAGSMGDDYIGDQPFWNSTGAPSGDNPPDDDTWHFLDN